MSAPRKPPLFDIPGMGRVTAAEFVAAHNAGEAPAEFTIPGVKLAVHDDGRSVIEVHDSPGGDVRTWVETMRRVTDRRWSDPLFYIGARRP